MADALCTVQFLAHLSVTSNSVFDLFVLFLGHGDKQDKIKRKALVEPYFKDNERYIEIV